MVPVYEKIFYGHFMSSFVKNWVGVGNIRKKKERKKDIFLIHTSIDDNFDRDASDYIPKIVVVLTNKNDW